MVVAKNLHERADALGIIRGWGQVYTLTSTHCAACGLPLRDAVSVTRGIGPECSRKHYEVSHTIEVEMVEEALGHLFASGLAEPVKSAARSLKNNPRDLCNILLWWSSAHLDQSEVVLDCAKVVTALGFVSLGERLRERNTDVIFSEAPDGSRDIILRCRSRARLLFQMKRVREATPVSREGRFKFGWRFPAARKDLVWTILGEEFGDRWATVPPSIPGGTSEVIKIPARTSWDVRAAFRLAYPPEKRAGAPKKDEIVRPGKPGWLEVHTPHRNFAFVSEFKAAIPHQSRSWSYDQMCWRVESHFENTTRTLVAKHFHGAT